LQPVLDGPRVGLVASQVVDLLTRSSSVNIESGLEVYDNDLNLKGDLAGNLQNGSSVQSNATALIHRSCTLVLDADAPFNYLSDFVKPYMVITDATTLYSVRFNLGVYSLVSPSPDLTLAPGQASYTGYDLLQILNQPLGDAYEIAVGSNPVTKATTLISSIFPAANFITTTNAVTTTQVYTWPLDNSHLYTYLDIVNGLMALIGYAPVWVDWDGNFRMHPYVDPNNPNVGTEWSLDLTDADRSITAESRSVYQDVYDVPNQWVYVMNNLTAAPVEGSTKFTFTDIYTPVTSVAARGRIIRKVVSVDAIDFNALLVAAVKGIEEDLHPTEAFAISTFPLPLLWHRDLISYKDPVLGTIGPLFLEERRTMVSAWQLPLDVVSGNMTVTMLSTSVATTISGNG
jgi:hypothetical protein